MSLTQLDVLAEGPPQLNRFGVSYEGKRMFCMWPWRTLVLTCDGTVVCGCGDARNENKMGHVGSQSALEIWQGSGFQRMRRGMHANRPPAFCYKCGLMEVHDGDYQPPDLPLVPQTYPQVLYVEPTIICNLRCPQPACEVEVYDTRVERMLPFDLYKKVIDEVGPHIERMVFYNYGESFLHKEAFKMLKYAKDVNPNIWIWTSTNGHYFDKPDKVAALVDSGINEVQFSVDGATQEVYETYRKRGKLDKVLKAIHDVVEERERRGLLFPWIIWNYILFRWNDSDEELDKARRLARELGVDRLTFATTDQPLGFPSERYYPGKPDYERVRHALIDGGRKLPNALVWDARIEAREIPRAARPGELFVARFRATNTGEMPWVAAGTQPYRKVYLCARLHDAAGHVIDDTFAQVGMAETVEAGQGVDLTLIGRVPTTPGRYHLKADLVRHGLWWFEHLDVKPIEWDLEVAGEPHAEPLLEVLSQPSTARGPDDLVLPIRIRGQATSTLDSSETAASGWGRIAIGMRWFRASDGQEVRASDRAALTPPLVPGEVRDLSISASVALLPAGTYRCRVDLVREACFWLADLGATPVEWTVEVEGSTLATSRVELAAPAAAAADGSVALRARVRGPDGASLDGTGPLLGRCGLGIRWFDAATGACVRDQERAYFDPPLAAAESRELKFAIPAGALPAGRYTARVGLLKEGHFWFESLGAAPLEVPIEIA